MEIGGLNALHESKMRSTSTSNFFISAAKGGALPEIYVVVPFVALEIPLVAMFRLLGIQSTDDMMRCVLHEPTSACNTEKKASEVIFDIVRPMLNHTINELTTPEIQQWIGRNGTKEVTTERRLRYVDHILNNEFMPHLGMDRTAATKTKKAVYLGFIVRRLVSVYAGLVAKDDRDHYANKRLDTVGSLMGVLFRQLFRNFLRTFKLCLFKSIEAGKYTNVVDSINAKRMTSALRYHFATGNWSISKSQKAHCGVVQILNRMTQVATRSQIMRLNTPINRDGKCAAPRQLHYTHWGINCPSETPEGQSCGLVKNLALMTHIRVGVDSNPVDHLLLEFGVRPIVGIPPRGTTIVMVNGKMSGLCTDGKELVRVLREARRQQELPVDASIIYKYDCVFVYTDSGCCMRPLFVVDMIDMLPNVLSLVHSNQRELWPELLAHGIIEYIDKEEEEDIMVAMSPKDLVCVPAESSYTHLEIHPVTILGLCTSLIPFADHNQAPRVSRTWLLQARPPTRLATGH